MNSDLKNYIEKFSNTEIALTEEYSLIKKLYENTDLYINSIKAPKSKNWSRLQGYITSKLLKDFIDEKLFSINSQYVTSELNSFIKGFPNEFDLLIVKRKNNNSFKNIYDPNDVKTIIEVKTSGIIATKVAIQEQFERMKEDINKIKLKYNSINYVYITILERGVPKRKNSRNYIDETTEGLQPYKSFFVFDFAENWGIRSGELIKFINEIIRN